MAVKYEVRVYGKSIREYEFGDVGKFRAYIRKKAKQGFYAINLRVYNRYSETRLGGGYTLYSLSLNQSPMYEGAKRTCLSYTTPGFQVYRGVIEYFGRNKAMMDYHGLYYTRDITKDAPTYDAVMVALKNVKSALEAHIEAVGKDRRIENLMNEICGFLEQ